MQINDGLEEDGYNLFDFVDYHKEADDVFSCLAELNRSVTIKLLAQVLLGQKGRYLMANELFHLASYGNWTDKTTDEAYFIIRALINRGFLTCKRVPNGKIGVFLSRTGLERIHSSRPLLFTDLDLSEKEVSHLEYVQDTYEKLRVLRANLLKRYLPECPQMKLYHLARNDTLYEIARKQPTTFEELAKIGDMSEEKVKKFGSEVLKMLMEEHE